MGYPNFQHHPDGIIFVRTNSGIYSDTIVNFQSDSGINYSGLLDGYIGQYYEPGISHYLHTINSATPQGLNWPEGDAYIAAYDSLMAVKKARETADDNVITI